VSIPDARRCRAAGRDSWGPSSSLERKKRKSRAIARRGTVLIHSHTQHFYDRGSLFYCLNPSTVSPLSAPSVPRFAYISSETIVCDIPPIYPLDCIQRHGPHERRLHTLRPQSPCLRKTQVSDIPHALFRRNGHSE
jgi:hypothetical protein